MAEHTPGPWEIVDFRGWPQGQLSIQAGPMYVANVFAKHPNCNANARLIAAAPDLLAAAERLAAVNNDPMTFEASDFDAAWNAMHEAIAKAKGG